MASHQDPGSPPPIAARRLRGRAPQCTQPFDQNPGANGFPVPEYFEGRRRKVLRNGMDPAFCGRAAAYVVEGRAYCSAHAGSAALAILLGERRAAEGGDHAADPSQTIKTGE